MLSRTELRIEPTNSENSMTYPFANRISRLEKKTVKNEPNPRNGHPNNPRRHWL